MSRHSKNYFDQEAHGDINTWRVSSGDIVKDAIDDQKRVTSEITNLNTAPASGTTTPKAPAVHGPT